MTSRRRSRSDATLFLPTLAEAAAGPRGRVYRGAFELARATHVGCKASARPCRLDLSGCVQTPCALLLQADLHGGGMPRPFVMCPRCHALAEANLELVAHRAKRLPPWKGGRL